MKDCIGQHSDLRLGTLPDAPSAQSTDVLRVIDVGGGTHISNTMKPIQIQCNDEQDIKDGGHASTGSGYMMERIHRILRLADHTCGYSNESALVP